jgi:hypothetical protein
MQRIAVAVMGTLLCLSGCDIDLFGLDWKRLGGGYSLVLTETDDKCGLIPPHGRGGRVIAEVGWQKPLILTRGAERESWDIIDTTTRRETKITDEQRRTDPNYRDIPVYRARDAWNRLKRYRSVW